VTRDSYKAWIVGARRARSLLWILVIECTVAEFPPLFDMSLLYLEVKAERVKPLCDAVLSSIFDEMIIPEEIRTLLCHNR
jgi:hypothetical protein